MFEWEDKTWFPEFLRNMQTDFIGWLVVRFGIYRSIQTEFSTAVELAGANKWTDLASGNGWPALGLLKELRKEDSKWADFQLHLTDLFPRKFDSLPEHVSSADFSVDALKWDTEQSDIRTVFNAYHHFDEQQKAKLIQQHAKKGLFVVEVLQPTLLVLIKIIFTTTIGQLLLTPFVKPFSWTRLFFTYILPVNLFTITWDGVVSVLKSKHIHEMTLHAKQHLPEGCLIQSGTKGPWWAPVSWFYIVPSPHE